MGLNLIDACLEQDYTSTKILSLCRHIGPPELIGIWNFRVDGWYETC